MKLKQLFCRHKNLTAIDQYIPKYKPSLTYTTTGFEEIVVELECQRCGKKIEKYKSDVQYERHNFYIAVDVNNLTKYKEWGGKQETPTRNKD